MQYEVPKIDLSDDLQESLNNIEKVVEDLNQRRDKGLDKDLELKLRDPHEFFNKCQQLFV